MREILINGAFMLGFMSMIARGFWVWSQLSLALSQFFDHVYRAQPEKWHQLFGAEKPSIVRLRRRDLGLFEEVAQHIEPVEGPLELEIEKCRVWMQKFRGIPLYFIGSFVFVVVFAILVTTF